MPHSRLSHPYPPHYPSMPRLFKEAQTHHQHKALHQRRAQESKSKTPRTSPILSMRRMQSPQRTMYTKSHNCRPLPFRTLRANRRRQKPQCFVLYARTMQAMPRHQNRGHKTRRSRATEIPINAPIEHCKRLQKTPPKTPKNR